VNAIAQPGIERAPGALMELGKYIETVEEAYEFMLAYAAQGRRDERGATGPGIRHFLSRLDAALDALPDCAAAACRERGSNDDCTGILAVLAEDARRAHALIRFVLSRETIGSQLADNLNASIHLRALLTDLFVLDESLKVAAAARPGG
jgi:hypothetical protein